MITSINAGKAFVNVHRPFMILKNYQNNKSESTQGRGEIGKTPKKLASICCP
jgi:hypothetical protein